MSDNLAVNVQFCDEYEDLFHNCLDALTRWTQLRDFDRRSAAGGPASSDVSRAEHNYMTAFAALRWHSRSCILCEQTLRAHINAAADAPTYRVS